MDLRSIQIKSKIIILKMCRECWAFRLIFLKSHVFDKCILSIFHNSPYLPNSFKIYGDSVYFVFMKKLRCFATIGERETTHT